ncbi:cytochrome P450, CYP85 clan [Monoraphidium neglectum]|uniref:Cytochrome P450, CYP85 clan n=1 Tax=Monoraphidium neglectum TaxID=145388 RepID=A0A0D2J5X6_9CHLO|nr:cytochrome P450, CYP85 clan [Monoraphidium neglectum]KIY95292.1 cytochrome P450, CYP85 clan [Monoraphidium neglectum]|eukprot:XP_013894312.1 cytochrome P450, CYP85 clan [Monoraphidium neglectum]
MHIQARRELLAIFLADTTAARARLADGKEVPGQLGTLVAATDADGRPLPDNVVAENLLGFMFAGHDTTSTSLTQLLAVLQEHPAVVDKLRAEQAALVAKHGPGVSGAMLREMVYADAVVK